MSSNLIKLFTPINIMPSDQPLEFGAGIASIGSCFSDNLANWLRRGGMAVASNPCGIVYNAVSIANTLQRLAECRPFVESDFFLHNGLWRNWESHGAFAAMDLVTALEKGNNALTDFSNAVVTAQLVVVTLSTSVVFELKENGQIVANCHKVPSEKFNRRLLSYQENVAAIRKITQALNSLAPQAQLVLTLSPVRHLPGDLVLNARSKALLLTAIHEIVEQTDNVAYFPSYDIMNDELRDYRFYNSDLLHPSELAVEIICQRFAETWFNAEGRQIISANQMDAKRLWHRPHYGITNV